METTAYPAMAIAGIGLQLMIYTLASITDNSGKVPSTGALDPKAQLFVTVLFLWIYAFVIGVHTLLLPGAWKASAVIPLGYLIYYIFDYRGIARLATPTGQLAAGLFSYLATWAYGLVWLITTYTTNP